jgi:hypothetical protein
MNSRAPSSHLEPERCAVSYDAAFRATLTTRTGEVIHGFMPPLYACSTTAGDSTIRVGRTTTFDDVGRACRAVGQRDFKRNGRGAQAHRGTSRQNSNESRTLQRPTCGAVDLTGLLVQVRCLAFSRHCATSRYSLSISGSERAEYPRPHPTVR